MRYRFLDDLTRTMIEFFYTLKQKQIKNNYYKYLQMVRLLWYNYVQFLRYFKMFYSNSFFFSIILYFWNEEHWLRISWIDTNKFKNNTTTKTLMKTFKRGQKNEEKMCICNAPFFHIFFSFKIIFFFSMLDKKNWRWKIICSLSCQRRRKKNTTLNKTLIK